MVGRHSLLATLVVVLILLARTPAGVSAQSTATVSFDPPSVTVAMDREVNGTFVISGLRDLASIKSLSLLSPDENIARVIEPVAVDVHQETIKGNFRIEGVFLGRQSISFQVQRTNGQTELLTSDSLSVVVIREARPIDHIFTTTVIVLVSIIYINFGAVMQLDVLKGIMRRPIGPAIGFVTQFLVMPLLSYGLGQLLFPDNHAMQLGLFFTGVSPAGGASNIWTAVLGGNIDLSVTMTTISTFAAFGMMPLWLFTLGRRIFENANIKVPYSMISGYAFCLAVPLAIGFLIQRYMPRTKKVLVRVLKPFSTLLIIFIVVFAIVANLYIFKLFSWQIYVAGMGLPWLGYMIGWVAAKCFRCPSGDAMAIAVETGVQNTGIAIYLLRFALPQPEGDLTTVVPVAVACMTPLPLTLLFLGKMLYRK